MLVVAGSAAAGTFMVSFVLPYLVTAGTLAKAAGVAASYWGSYRVVNGVFGNDEKGDNGNGDHRTKGQG